MTHLVISQTWLHAGDEHLAAYMALVRDYDNFLRAQPGFVSRRMVHSLDDSRHLIHLREFESVEDYEAMTTIAEYRDQIAALSEHVDATAYPDGAVAREYGDILFDS